MRITTIRFEPEAFEAIQQEVRDLSAEQREDVSVAQIVRGLVDDWLATRRAERTKTETR